MRTDIRFSYICSLLWLRPAKPGQAGNPKLKPKPFLWHFGIMENRNSQKHSRSTRGEAQPRRPANARHPQPCQHRTSNAHAQPAQHRPGNPQPSPARPEPPSPPGKRAQRAEAVHGSFVPRTLGTQSLPASHSTPSTRCRGRFLFAERASPSKAMFLCEHSTSGRNN